MAASGQGHSACRYLHIEAVFVLDRDLDHLSVALAGTDFFPQHCDIAAHSLKAKAKAKGETVASCVDAALSHSQPYEKEYDHEDSDDSFHPPLAQRVGAAVTQDKICSACHRQRARRDPERVRRKRLRLRERRLSRRLHQPVWRGRR